MPIAISKAIAISSIPNLQQLNFSPNLNASYWVAQAAQVPNLSADAKLTLLGYYDQAGYDTQGCVPMCRLTVVIPAASVSTALASDSALGTFLLTLPQFSGGSAAEAA